MVEAAPSVLSGSAPSAPRHRYARIALLIARIALGAIFLYAAYAKLHYAGAWHLRDYDFIFAFGITSYQMLSVQNALWLARFLPWLEVALGVFLIGGIALRWVGAVATALLLVFMTALARAWMLRLEITCGCFGNQSESPGRELLLDGLLLLLAVSVTAGAFLSARGRRLAP
jgi:uncharacterized membrane protein YphA (DoxX/SURF4 family)